MQPGWLLHDDGWQSQQNGKPPYPIATSWPTTTLINSKQVNLISGQIGSAEMSVEPGFRPINKMTLAELSTIYFIEIDLIFNDIIVSNIVQ